MGTYVGSARPLFCGLLCMSRMHQLTALRHRGFRLLWMDTLFSSNPWQSEGAAGPRQQLAFMVCYNIDRFRRYAAEHNLLNLYRLDKSRKRLIETDDEALLTFGYDWLKLVLGNKPTLQLKR